MTFTIPGELPGLNEYIHAINRNRHIGNRMKQDTQEAIQWAVRAQIKRGYNYSSGGNSLLVGQQNGKERHRQRMCRAQIHFGRACKHGNPPK